jgi:hypothetical protein
MRVAVERLCVFGAASSALPPTTLVYKVLRLSHAAKAMGRRSRKSNAKGRPKGYFLQFKVAR